MTDARYEARAGDQRASTDLDVDGLDVGKRSGTTPKNNRRSTEPGKRSLIDSLRRETSPSDLVRDIEVTLERLNAAIAARDLESAVIAKAKIERCLSLLLQTAASSAPSSSLQIVETHAQLASVAAPLLTQVPDVTSDTIASRFPKRTSLFTGTDKQVRSGETAWDKTAQQWAHGGSNGDDQTATAQLPYRGQMEQAFGRSFAHVESHTGRTDELAPLGAQAITVGSSVHFADAQPSPELVAHELTHVVQNDQVGASLAMASGVVAPRDSAAETEADANATRVASLGSGVRLPAVTAAPAAHLHLHPTDPTPSRMPAEDRITAILGRAVASSDAPGLQQRIRDLSETFAALPSPDRRVLRERLRHRKSGDTLAALFQLRLSTPAREQLLRALDGEPTPLPARHASIEPEAFVGALAVSSVTIVPEHPKLAGYPETVAEAKVSSPLSPPEGHTTEVVWNLVGEDGVEYSTGRQAWPALQLAPVLIPTFELSGGRTAMTVEIVVDGTVRRTLRKLIEVNVGTSKGPSDLPAGVVAQIHSAFATPIKVNQQGEPEEEATNEMLAKLRAIIPSYRAAVVAQLSAAPSGRDTLAALFMANVPPTLRPRVIAALTSGYVEPMPDAIDATVDSYPIELLVSPRPLVIAPWMHHQAKLTVAPQDPSSAGIPTQGPELEVFWSITDGADQPISEHRTTWVQGTFQGESLVVPVGGPAVYKITAHIGQHGVAGQSVTTTAEVLAEDTSDAVAGEQMDPIQALEERAKVRAQMTSGTATPEAQAELWMRASALDANLAAHEVVEHPPPVADSEAFAPPSWINHTAPGRNQPVSTSRAQLRFLIEQRYKGDQSLTPPLSIALTAYINDSATEPENRAKAETIRALAKAEEDKLEEESSAFQIAFGKKGHQVCLQMLDEGKRDVLAKQREYGIPGANAKDTADSREDLAEAAMELISLHNTYVTCKETADKHEKELAALHARANAADPSTDEFTHLIEAAEELKNVLAVEYDSVPWAEEQLELRKAELEMRFPILTIANVGDQGHPHLDYTLLRQIAKGDLGTVASKLTGVLANIEKVRGEIDDDSVWSIPMLLQMTKSSLGITPGTFQNHAIDWKLRNIEAGKLIKMGSGIAAAVLATIASFGTAGPALFAMDAAMTAQGAVEAVHSFKEYQFQKALTGTHYDKAKALSQDDPSAFWLAFEIVTTFVGSVATAAQGVKAFNAARKAYGAIRTARKAVEAVNEVNQIAPKLNELAEMGRANKLSEASLARLRTEALEQLAKRVGPVGEHAGDLLKGSKEFAAKAAEFTQVLKEQVSTLSKGKGAVEFEVRVLPEAEFEARFGSKRAKAVFTMSEGKPAIFAKITARPRDLADEAAHIVQLSDPKLAADLKYLNEAHLTDWKKMSVSDKLEFYQRKLNVEIDAKQRRLASIADRDEYAIIEKNLTDLKKLQDRVAKISDEELSKMNAGLMKEPEFLDQPARAFTKEQLPDGPQPARPDLNAVDPHAPPPRAVTRDKTKVADYSTAYNDANVKNVGQHGEAWKERVFVTSGYKGKIKGIKPGDNASTIVTIESDGGKIQDYVVEAGAEFDAKIKVGADIGKGDSIAKEVPRDYRYVEVEYTDGSKVIREEIKSAKKNVGWVPRGSEASARGAAAEKAAMHEADEVLAAAHKAGQISGSAHLPHRVGGGGFDDVIVEFVGEGKNMTARVRIREVKDYPNRHVPLGEFTALNENWEQNLAKLKQDVEEALAGAPSGAYKNLTTDQLGAINKQLRADVFEVEIRLGESTKLGEAGHHASTTLPTLERTVGRNINVKRIGEGDR